MKNIVLVNDWDELKALNLENDEWRVEIKEYNGWIVDKIGDKLKSLSGYYLSTHTFYGDSYNGSTKLLQDCGFNVQLKNWDGETIWIKEE